MKLVLIDDAATTTYALLTGDGVVPLTGALDDGFDSPQAELEYLIESFDVLRPRLGELAASSPAIPLVQVRLLPPVPWPGKILVTTATCDAPPTEAPPQLLATLKSPESVVGPGATIQLPDVPADTWQFVPQAMLGLVIRGPAKDVSAENWRRAVFGYTCVIDVMARGDQTFGRDYWLAKSDSLGPLGPCIVTVDEIADPTPLRVQSWQNGSPAQDFVVGDASHSIPEQVAFATTVLTLHSGDILACGTAPTSPRPLADGDTVDVEVDDIGRLSVRVTASARPAV
jgi:2-keto-4-pentenoate hydratase/2-oxohepta-3-ene-1,7-dioic acid hydratase in catechol pathway